jgi:hypothetical protein
MAVLGEVVEFFSSNGSVSFVLRMSNDVIVVLQPCNIEYVAMVQHALQRGGHASVHPTLPVMSIEGKLIPLRTFFGVHPFTRLHLEKCGMCSTSSCTNHVPSQGKVVLALPQCERKIAVEIHDDVSDESDEDNLDEALADLRESIQVNVIECRLAREERINVLRAERDRLRTWIVGDAYSSLIDVVLRPTAAPSNFSSGWTLICGIYLPALEEYSRCCSGCISLVLKSAYIFSDRIREQCYIDACAGLRLSSVNIPVWSCGNGQYLMWRDDSVDDVWVQEALSIDVGINIPVCRRTGVKVYLRPPAGAKSAIIVRVALGRCASSPTNASALHDSAKCADTVYMVFCSSLVIPAFRVVFF